jgi:DNA-binding transcriptional regulator LsrR (DeoR family)
MNATPYTDEQLILAARLYFLDGLPQATIGKLVNVSQPKVSRMLALARERGLVRISVPDYEPRNAALEAELARALGVEAVVIRAVAGLRVADLRQTLGYFAAPVVAGWLGRSNGVAVAGGRTLQALVERLTPPDPGPRPGMTVVQAMGNIDSSPGPYDAVELGRALARRWQARFLTLNTPAILPDAETCQRLLGLEQIGQVLGALEGAELALVGVGTLENSVFVERGVLAARDLELLRQAGAVGEVLGRFYDAQGNECATPLRRRVVSPELDRLRRVSKKVGVVVGVDRAAAVAAAVRGGLLDTLVTDEASALALREASR